MSSSTSNPISDSDSSESDYEPVSTGNPSLGPKSLNPKVESFAWKKNQEAISHTNNVILTI